MLYRFATVRHAGEQTWYGDAGEEPDSKQRRLNLIKAVEGDDWSAVIDSQTQQTIEGLLAAEVPPVGLSIMTLMLRLPDLQST